MMQHAGTTEPALSGSRQLYLHLTPSSTAQQRTERGDSGASDVERALRERVKELTCLYCINELVEKHRADVPRLMQNIVELLPPSWQFSHVCCARLILKGQEYLSADFQTSSWRQMAEIRAGGDVVGTVEVFYRQARPPSDEGPFLREERVLIQAVADRIGRIVEHIETQQRLHEALRQLQVERTALQEANTALRGVMARVEEDKRAVEDAVVSNVDKVLMPVLHALEDEVPSGQRKYVTLLREHLADIVSPFADKLSKTFMNLTSIEIRICGMIRDGMTTREIAEVRHVSPATVSRQRERIRQKLGIAGSDVNLTTYLRTFLHDATS